MPRKAKVTLPLLEGSSRQIAATLQEEIRRLEGARPISRDDALLSAGCMAMDQLLPEGGLRRGWLTEWLGIEGGGAGALALVAAREACLDGGALVVMDRERCFYPPAAAALGIDLEATIVVRPQNHKDELWALDQVLRCRGVAAVWARLGNTDDRTFRRLQLAAEEGGVLGLLIRPDHLRGKPSWSEVQFWIEPKVVGAFSAPSAAHSRTDAAPSAPARVRRLRVEVTRCRSGPTGGAAEVEFDEVTGALRGANFHEETHPLFVAPSVADSTAHRRSTTA